MKQTVYRLSKKRLGRSARFALISDLHGGDPTPVLEALKQKKPDAILMPGDIFETLDGVDDLCHRNALSLLRGAAQIAPVYYSLGNHEDGATRSWSGRWRNRTAERRLSPKDLQAIADTGAILLDDRFVLRNGFCFGGLSSGLIREGGTPELAWLDEFCAADAPKILLCHHPEYYERFLQQREIDLTVSGHAHGGQWRIFGRGVFAPGQGIFPKYTSGVHEGRLVISRGLKKGGKIPRIFNPTELVWIEYV